MDSVDMNQSQTSERTKWLNYGKHQIMNGHIDNMKNGRVYIVDSHSEPKKKKEIHW